MHFTKNLSIGLICSLPLITHASTPFILDGSIKAGNNRNYAQIGAFAPLTSNDDDLIFGDVRYMHHLSHTKSKKKNALYDPKSYEANFGLGYRKALDEDMVAGGVVYYDIRNAQISNALFSQVTLNVHLLTSTWQTHANLYAPVGKKKVTKTTDKFTGKGKVINRDIFFTFDQNQITEKSLPGLDFRISRNIPNIENVRIGSLFYYFKDKKAIAGGGIDLSWTMNDNIKFETSYTYDRVRKSNILAGIRFQMPVGKAGKGRKLDALMVTRVERDLDIVTNSASDSKQKNIQQTNMMAVGKNDLSNVNSVGLVGTNMQILNKLQNIHDQNGVIILADDGQEFDFNKVAKIAGDELKQKVATEQASAAAKLSANNTINTVLDTAQAENDPLTRQIKVLAAQKAHQGKANHSGFFLGGKQHYNIHKDLDRLFAKYATTTNNAGHKIFNITLPGYPNAIIERAGSILLVKENGQVYTILATDQNNVNKHKNDGKLPYNTWFSGQVDSGDVNVAETVTRETFEESAGSVYISQTDFDDAIKDGRFFYNQHHKILTIVHPDVDGLYNITDLDKNLNKLKQTPGIAKAMKEAESYHKVHISELLKLYQNMQNASNNPHTPAYNVKDTSGNTLRIERHYAKSFASPNANGALLKAQNKL